MANGILGAIANPQTGNVLGGILQGQQFLQGAQALEEGKAKLGQQQKANEVERLRGEVLASGFSGKLADLTKLSPEAGLAVSEALGIPPDEPGRIKNMMGLAQVVSSLMTKGLVPEAKDILLKEKEKLNGLQIATPKIDEQIALIDTKPEEVAANTAALTQAGIEAGILTDPTVAIRKEEAATGKLLSETAQIKQNMKIKAIQTGLVIPEAFLAGLPDDRKAGVSEAFRIAGGGKDGLAAANDFIKDLRLDKSETTKKNVARISELSKGVKSREASLVKAKEFLTAFQDGGAESGTTRRILSFLPGVFSNQAEFDEKLDSFSEIAAREKLKAVGEIRPTDADVEGMKRALFGIGRDEPTNVALLEEFILELEGQDQELGALRGAKRDGELGTFTGLVTGFIDVEVPAPATSPIQPEQAVLPGSSRRGRRKGGATPPRRTIEVDF